MPYVTSIERLGRQEGRQEGRTEGRQEEAANLIIRLARKRFACLGPEVEAAIRQLPLTELEALSEALLDFATINDLRLWLGREQQQ